MNRKAKESMISIIVPFYNSEKYIEQCLLSVQTQTYEDIEILCVNDGSEDGSEDIVRKFSENDSRFRLLRQPRANAGQARNTGIRCATGEYLCFLDSDDFLYPDMIEKMLNECVKTKCDICICDADDYDNGSGRYTYQENKYLKKYYMPKKQPFHPYEISDFVFWAIRPAPWGKIFRTAFVKENGIEFQAIPRAEDVLFVDMQIALAQRIAYTEEILLHHRVGLTSNLSNGHHKTPLVYSYVIKGLFEALQDKNIYAVYERSFLYCTALATSRLFICLSKNIAGDEMIQSSRQIYKQLYRDLNLFPAFLGWGKSLVEKQDSLRLDMFLDYVECLYCLKRMDIYDASLENEFIRTIDILREKYEEILRQLPFGKSNQKIGIYGAGEHTKGLLAVYQKLIGPVNAAFVYITSENPVGCKEGMSQIVYTAIDDSFDAIIVSSYIYNHVMHDNLSKVYDENRIISFYPPFKRDIFAILGEKRDILDLL